MASSNWGFRDWGATLKNTGRKKTGATTVAQDHPIDIGYESLASFVTKVLDTEKLNIPVENLAPSVRVDSAKIQLYCCDIDLSDTLGFSTMQTEYAFQIQYLVTFNGIENRLAGKLCVLLTRAFMEHEQFRIVGKKLDFGDWRAFEAIPQPYVLVKIPVTVKRNSAAAALVRVPLVIKSEQLRQ